MDNLKSVNIKDSLPFDKNKRRKKIVVFNILFTVVAYIIAYLISILAKAAGLPTVSTIEITILLLLSISLPLFFIVLVLRRKEITHRYSNKIFYIQYTWWCLIYMIWLYLMHEIRFVALIYAFTGLIYLTSTLKQKQTLLVLFIVVCMHLSVSFFGIHFMDQEGIFLNELFYIVCFIPTCIYVSYMSKQFHSQKDDIKNSKKQLELRTDELDEALNKVTAVNNELKTTRDKLWEEMQLAKKIQTVLLPETIEIDGYEIAALMVPADEVGGDYYDVINVGDIDFIAIGDVSGHGVPAGLIMMMAQTAIRTLANYNKNIEPASLLEVTNRIMRENLERLNEDKYMTITIMAKDVNGRFVFSGLHLDLIIHRSATNTIEIIESSGMWLGIIDDIKLILNNDSFEINKGDTLILYTDGIIEAENKYAIDAEDHMFGNKRFLKSFEDNIEKKPESLITGILDDATEYEFKDDVTMIVVRKN